MVVTPIAGKQQAGAVVMHLDISELRKLEKERMESKIAEQKNITQAMILGQEKERNAIGRELHDNMNQILAGVNLLLGMLKTRPERLAQYLPLCIDNINLAITENRKIAHELVSPNQVSESLISQIERLCTNMLQNAGLETTIDAEDFDERMIKDDQKLAIYRVVQEQCSNIVKYAQAGNVEFRLSTIESTLALLIKDDGQGMKPGKKSDGIGLQNMMSRISVLNGKLNIDSKPGKGFTVEVEIPLN
jgi:signal transduction histidine kinase